VAPVSALGGTLLVAITIVGSCCFAQPTPALVTIHSFNGLDGGLPLAGLVVGKSGALYGTTYHGGTSDNGTTFELVPPTAPGGAWTETVLYNFAGGSDGRFPQCSLVFDANGALYGTTNRGGPEDDGTVFQLVPPAAAGGAWTENILHAFMGRNDGAHPYAGVVIGSHGELYGTTDQGGGSIGLGTVFRLAPPAVAGGTWAESILSEFPAGGQGPAGGVVLGKQGVIYGTTTIGGNGFGVVFGLAGPAGFGGYWTETVLHNFNGTSDGANPTASLVIGKNGSLYGTTYSDLVFGAGTVFELSAPAVPGGTWIETVLHQFTNSDGANPEAALIIGDNGSLYGTTTRGPNFLAGTVFELNPPTVAGAAWTETVLYSFSGGSDGGYPKGALAVGANGAFYGTTSQFGAGHGTVFELTR